MTPAVLAQAKASWPELVELSSPDARVRSDWRLWLSTLGTVILLVAWGVAELLPFDAGADTDLARRFAPPGTDGDGHLLLLGRDHFGRDLFRMLVQGTSAFIRPGWIALAFALPVGVLLWWRTAEKDASWGRANARARESAALDSSADGSAREGTFSTALESSSPFTLAISGLPTLAWLLLVSVASGQSLTWMAIALGLLQAPSLSRALLTRHQRLVHRGVVQGAAAQGLSSRIVWRFQQLPLELLPELCRFVPHMFSVTLLLETAMSYLGDFGAPESIPSWGRMLRDLSDRLFRVEPGAPLWVALVPVAAIMLSSLTLQVCGERWAHHLERRHFDDA